MESNISLVTGGARSGKSVFAEELLACAAGPKAYIATARIEDDEMARRVAWLVKIHMKFHYFANTGQGDVDKWLRKEALKGPFNRSGELAEAVIQASQVAAADALGCGDGTADTSGTLAFGQFMAELAREMPVSVKDMVYDRRIPDMCGSKTKKCLQVLLKRIQNKDLENNADVLAEAAEKWLKRFVMF